MTPGMVCRHCGTALAVTFCDLGMSPLSNSLLTEKQLSEPERSHPLCAMVCAECFLVQLPEIESPESIFGDYLYFSSYSTSWLEHASRYCDQMERQLGLNGVSLVVEIASNDGYLLQYFRQKQIPVLGIEPASNVAKIAMEKGIPTRVAFFGVELATQLRAEGVKADLLLGNNVLAHVPDINDFVAGVGILLQESGTVTFEFPHLLQLIRNKQFDTIYHEHFSYLSLMTVQRIFAAHRLQVFDVEELETHGGSLRVFAQLSRTGIRPLSQRVAQLLAIEAESGLHDVQTYASFGPQTLAIREDLVSFLQKAHRDGKKVAAYGAPAKGNTLLNYCGVTPELLAYTVDRSPHKQGLYLPGTHIPVYAPERLKETQPDFILLLPWNLREELVQQLAYTREWGARLVLPIPRLEIIS